MDKRSRSRRRFLGFLLVWFLLFVLVALLAVRWLQDFLTAFEASRPETAVQRYMETLDRERILEIAGEGLSGLDTRLESPEESLALLRPKLSGDITPVKKSSESSEKRYVYTIKSGKTAVGKITVETEDDVDSLLSTPHWEVTGEEYDISSLVEPRSAEITVDDSLTVSFHGVTLDSSYITEDGIGYDQLKEYYSSVKGLPHMATYSVSGYLGDYDFTVTDEAGNTVELPEAPAERQNLFLRTRLCSGEDFSRLEEFSKEFVRRYVRFSSNENDNFNGNLASVQEYVVPGSDFYNLLPQAREGMTYSHVVSNEIKAITLNWAFQLEDGSWLADVTYDVFAVSVKTDGKRAEQTTRNNYSAIIVTSPEKGMLVESWTVNNDTEYLDEN